MDPKDSDITVYYDGRCPSCIKDMHTYDKLSSAAGKPVTWVDITGQEDHLHRIGIDPVRALMELHIQDQNQKVLSEMDAYIGVRGTDNVSEWSDIPSEKMGFYESNVWKKVHIEIRVPDTRWVVLRWPSPSMAQLAHDLEEVLDSVRMGRVQLDREFMDLLFEAVELLQLMMAAAQEKHRTACTVDESGSCRRAGSSFGKVPAARSAPTCPNNTAVTMVEKISPVSTSSSR